MTREFLPENTAIKLAERRRREGRTAEAALICHDVLRTQSLSYEAEYVLGVIAQQESKPSEAIEHFRRAVLLAPELAFLHADLGEMYWFVGRQEEAAVASRNALALHPQFAEPLNNLARVALWRGQSHEAIDLCRRAIALKPRFAEAYDNLGNILREIGQLEEAERAYARAVEIAPDNAVAVANLSNVHRFFSGDPRISAIEKLKAKTGLSDLDRLLLDFALGKAYAEVADYPLAFACFKAGNAAKRGRVDYDERSTLALFETIERVFTPELIKAKSGSGHPSTVPVFILGMPRSGTTLVEQILASHPVVHGGGELRTFQDVIQTVRSGDGRPILGPKMISGLDAGTFDRIGTNYLAAVQALAPKALRITDKMLSNLYFVGLIYLTLPHAKIIHMMRDPVDTCISCFSTLFTGDINYSYDLGELGRYYRHYQGLMAHWRKLLPPGHMLEVQYENVVADLDGEARRMLAYCGLEWDSRCTQFHKTSRPVRTASAAQVRRPIYRSSVGRWRMYENEIGPLLAELGR